MNKKTVRDIDVSGKRVLVRVDFNVPLENGTVSDDTRIRAALPTIQYLIDHKAKTILCSHLGRPKGKPDPAYSLGPVSIRLSQLLGREVRTAPDCIGPAVQNMVHNMQPGDLLLLENLRFHSEEEANEAGFVQALASLADVMWMMPLAQRIAHMRQPLGWQSTCRRWLDSSWNVNSTFWAAH